MNHPLNHPFSDAISEFPTQCPTGVRPADARGTDAVAMGLWRSLALRDEATAMHSMRVAQWVVLLADECGLSTEERWSLRRGALLHDIGKLGVPDAVLNKPGALDEAERTLVNGHPESGYALLRAVEPLRGIAHLVRHHHERWDGRGYPGGLAGEEIPRGARLLAVCDTFDAMTSDRPYRQGMAREVALAAIGHAAGSQLDPEATAAFLRIARWSSHSDPRHIRALRIAANR
jgi:putative nucleotidyltransferase with HDIG domain